MLKVNKTQTNSTNILRYYLNIAFNFNKLMVSRITIRFVRGDKWSDDSIIKLTTVESKLILGLEFTSI